MRLFKTKRGYYHVAVKREDGTYKVRSTHRTNKEEAEAMVRDAKIPELEYAAEIGLLSQDIVATLLVGRKVTVEDAIEPWIKSMTSLRLSGNTIHNSAGLVRSWAASQGLDRTIVGLIKPDHIDPWVNAIGERKAGTRAVMLAAVRSFCGFCSNSGWLQGNPANLVRVDLGAIYHAGKETLRRPCFTDDEVRQLVLHTSPDGLRPDRFWNSAVIIGRYTGLRIGDICSLEWDCFDLTPGKMTVWTQKRDKRVCLPIEPEILALTIAGLDREHPRYVFRMRHDMATDPSRRAQLSNQFGRLLAECGIAGKTFHCLRATYVSDCDRKGIPIEHICRQVGHSNSEITKRYIRPQ